MAASMPKQLEEMIDETIHQHCTQQLRTHYRLTEAARDEVVKEVIRHAHDSPVEYIISPEFAKILKHVYVGYAPDQDEAHEPMRVLFAVDICCKEAFEKRDDITWYRLDFACRQVQAEPRAQCAKDDKHFSKIVSFIKPRDASIVRVSSKPVASSSGGKDDKAQLKRKRGSLTHSM